MHTTHWSNKPYITTWDQFDREVRSKGKELLKKLDNFPNSILVTGCQRSGTTMLSRIITKSDGMVKYWFGPDDELDAALILSGYVDHKPSGRYCFQTTYNNREYSEYFNHDFKFHLIWVLRNPYSVIYSMLNNWSDYALDRLFDACGTSVLRGKDKLLYGTFGSKGIGRLRRACWSYIGKTAQLHTLIQGVPSDRFLAVDYDDLVTKKESMLPMIYQFLGLNYRSRYSEQIHAQKRLKKINLSRFENLTIRMLCEPSYLNAKQLITQF